MKELREAHMAEQKAETAADLKIEKNGTKAATAIKDVPEVVISDSNGLVVPDIGQE